jgi:alcohol dehydrogenase (cytochrome c)
MKFRRTFRRGAMLLLVLSVLLGGLFMIAPNVIAPFLPESARGSPDSLAEKLSWRLQFYLMKLKGEVPELSWSEIIEGTWPGKKMSGTWAGSGFIKRDMVEVGSTLDAAVANPLDDEESIEEGKKLFHANCAACHGNDGNGSNHAPSLAKSDYRVGASDLALYLTLRDGISGTAMPSLGLSIEQRWQLIGYLRTLDKKRANRNYGDKRAPPVDISWEDLLTAKSRADGWLTYSGSLDGWRHSPLTQITPANVSGLRLLWAHQFAAAGDEPFEATPLVAGGTIFTTEPPSNVVALDASSGREIWRYNRSLPRDLPVCCGSVNRGLAILGNNLFLGTLDASLLSIDATTGKVKWETRVADPNDGYSITGAPLIVKDAVIIGVSGGEYGARGFLTAYDANTGKQIWRFHTIPGQGEFGHTTWENEAWKTGGGPTWITGSYDPSLNLLYWGVGNPSPNFIGQVRPGDNLFTDSVIALDATSGKLVWHFQFTPHDEHDWDSNQTPVLADLVIDGIPRKVICWANRNGFYYVLDRTNGQFLRGVPFVDVSWASGLDGKGRPILTEAAKLTTTGTLTKPHVGGGTNWHPPSFDPATRSFLVHATEGASIYTNSAPDKLRRGEKRFYLGSGGSTEPVVNMVKALDAGTGALKWAQTSQRPPGEADQSYSGVITTDGGVAFSAYAGSVFALETVTGKELWRVGLSTQTKATPITFMLNGKQVVAVTGGKTLFLFGL